MDCIIWSAPFLADCVTKMFYALLSQKNTIYNREEENLDEIETEHDKIHALLKRGVTKNYEKKK